MQVVVDAALPAHIVVGATGLTGLAQEIRTVLATRKGSVPLDREFGLDWSVIDCPVQSFKSRYVADVSQQVERYVPRVKVLKVQFIAGTDAIEGILHPVVTVSIRPEFIHEFA